MSTTGLLPAMPVPPLPSAKKLFLNNLTSHATDKIEQIEVENVHLLVVFILFEVIKKIGDKGILIYLGIRLNPFEH